MPLDPRDSRLNNIALNARLYYLGQYSAKEVGSLVRLLAAILSSGAGWLPPDPETDLSAEPRSLDAAELYAELEGQQYSALLTFRKALGAQATLAALALLAMEDGDFHAVLETWGRLRQAHESRAKASAGRRKQGRATEARVLTIEKQLSRKDSRKRAAVIANRTAYSQQHVRRIRKKHRRTPPPQT